MFQSLSFLVEFWITWHFHITLRIFIVILVRHILILPLIFVLLWLYRADIRFWIIFFTFLKVLILLIVSHISILVIIELRIFLVTRSIFIWVHLIVFIVFQMIVFIRFFKTIILLILIVSNKIFLMILISAVRLNLSLWRHNWLLYTNSWTT